MVSIVILTLNQLPYTRQCLDTISMLTGGRYEIIFVDNGSSDGTGEFLGSFSRRVKVGCSGPERVIIIQNEKNLGFSKGCNQGILASNGEQILLLNNDTLVTPGWLDKLLALLCSKESHGMVGPVSNRTLPGQEVKGIELPPPGAFPDRISGLLRREGGLPASLLALSEDISREKKGRAFPTLFLSGFCLLIKRDVIETVGLLDESFSIGGGEDVDFCLRAANAGFESLVSEETFIYHYGGATFRGEGVFLEGVQDDNMKSCGEKWGLPATMRSGTTYVPEESGGILFQDPSLLSRWCGPLVSFDPRDPAFLLQYLFSAFSRSEEIGGGNSSIATGRKDLPVFPALELLVRGRYLESMQASRDCCARNGSPWGWYLLAEALRLLEEEEALVWFRKCCEAGLFPISAWAGNQIGVFFSLRKEWRKAEESLRAALDQPLPSSPRSVFLSNLGYVFLQQKRRGDAEEALRAAAAADPSTPGLWGRYATLLLRAGKKDEAMSFLESLLRTQRPEIPSGSLSVVLSLARLKMESGKFHDVVCLCGKIIERLGQERSDGELFSLRGMAYSSLGRHQEGILDLESAVKRLGESPMLLNNLAVAYSQLGNLPQAKNLLVRAVTVGPWFEKAKQNLAKLEEIMGKC